MALSIQYQTSKNFCNVTAGVMIKRGGSIKQPIQHAVTTQNKSGRLE
jgi:hypothetical protein